MRVLLVSQAEWSHAAGMVPLGWGFRAAGHDVLFATQPDLVADLAAGGLPTVGVGRDHHLGEVLQRMPRHRRAGRGLETLYLGEEGGWDTLVWSHSYVVRWWLALVNDPMLAGLVDLSRRWRPDLVVWETTTFAGALAARAAGARHVRFVWSIDLFGRMRHQFTLERDLRPASERTDPLAAWLGGRAERFGLEFDEELVTGQATITQVPASLRATEPEGLSYLPVRYLPYNGSSPVPAWVLAPADRPRVCVCLGMSAIARFGTYACSARDLLGELGELDVEVVAMLASSEHAALGTLPGNVRLESFVPLDALLPTCAAVVNHGGPGTLLTAAAHAVPQLVVPAEFDAPLLAAELARSGAGAALAPGDVRPGTVRDLVARLVGEPAFHGAAARLRDEMRAMPDPYELARMLADDAYVEVA
jgi:glycosyltransferase (activator-dependent family)